MNALSADLQIPLNSVPLIERYLLDDGSPVAARK